MNTPPIFVLPEHLAPLHDAPAILRRPTDAPFERDTPFPDANGPSNDAILPADAAYNEGVQKLRRGEWAAAVGFFTESLRWRPTHGAAWNNRGVARELAGDAEAALVDFVGALQVTSKNAAAWNNRGLAHLRDGNFDAAIRDFEEAMLLHPSYARARFNCGLARMHSGDLKGALTEFEEALRLDPRMEEAKRELESFGGEKERRAGK